MIDITSALFGLWDEEDEEQKEDNNDSYDIANAILELWKEHAHKHSGEIDKCYMCVPIFVNHNDEIFKIKTVKFKHGKGIILDLQDE
jgi:hypothetical protein